MRNRSIKRTSKGFGIGDAFGSGGRMTTCFHVTGDPVDFLIDCGARRRSA